MDTWKLKHLEDDTMVEEFEWKVPMKEEDLFVYLFDVISKIGNNITNIIHKKRKKINWNTETD